ncbi:small conserved [Micractinium conductrix]|uniref:Small conserved n=1 Tax=Micractinium conductrix TaxID=554055 RepID=A0A2P6V6B3_9CHLO|nr:small conserved [Micractinium conductrix]|eukprot:PSC69625.1 small conserved [Micractinium conductrix]
MGGGNAQKTAMARAKAQEKAKGASGGKSQLKDNAKALSIVCNICRQSFLCNMTEAKLKEHSDSRHAKNTFADCFPNFGK